MSGPFEDAASAGQDGHDTSDTARDEVFKELTVVFADLGASHAAFGWSIRGDLDDARAKLQQVSDGPLATVQRAATQLANLAGELLTERQRNS